MTAGEPEASHTLVVQTGPAHTAAAFGNAGVEVVGTPALIGFLETASADLVAPGLAPGEATVGTAFAIRHLAAAPAGATVDASARLLDRQGNRLSFAVEARWRGTVLMTGTHERAIVDLARFMARFASVTA